MAKRTPQTAAKREREQRRKERRALKDAKKLARKDGAGEAAPLDDPQGGGEPAEDRA